MSHRLEHLVIREFRRSRLALAAALALVVKAAPLFGQFPATLTPGTRVRVSIPDTVRQAPIGPRSQLIYGTVTASSADTLYLSVPNTQGSLAIPHASVRTLSISNGFPSRRRSALTSGAKYAVLGAAEFYLFHALGTERLFGSRDAAALGGAAFGFTFGAILGARLPAEQWSGVPVRSTARAQ